MAKKAVKGKAGAPKKKTKSGKMMPALKSKKGSKKGGSGSAG